MLANAWTTLGAYYLSGAPAQEAYAKAREAVDQALELSPNLSSAHRARGFLLQYAVFDWHGSEAESRRALALSPNDGNAQADLGDMLATLGEVEPAIQLVQRALVVEPLQPYWYGRLAAYLSGLNRLDEADRAIRRSIELAPGADWWHAQLTIIEIQRGQAQAALAVAKQEPPGPWQHFALALALQIGGDRNAADAALGTLIKKDAGFTAFGVAQAYAQRNDANATFEWLDRALIQRDSSIPGLLYDPFILRFRNDPRFAAFCKKVGLPTPAEVAARGKFKGT